MHRTRSISIALTLAALCATTYMGLVTHAAHGVHDRVVVAPPPVAATLRENEGLRIAPRGTRPARHRCAGCSSRAAGNSLTPRLTMRAARTRRS